jgi:hypothetical protein
MNKLKPCEEAESDVSLK